MGVRMRPRLAAVRGVDVTLLTPGIVFGRVGVSDENPGKNSDAIVPFAENTPMKRFAVPVFWACANGGAVFQTGLVSVRVKAPRPLSKRRRVTRVRKSFGSFGSFIM